MSGQKDYFKRSAKLLKVNAALFFFVLLVTFVLSPTLNRFGEVIELMVGLPMLALFVLVPIGLYQSIKSNRLKQGNTSSRLRHFIGHLVLSIIILGIFAVFVSDLLYLFGY